MNFFFTNNGFNAFFVCFLVPMEKDWVGWKSTNPLGPPRLESRFRSQTLGAYEIVLLQSPQRYSFENLSSLQIRLRTIRLWFQPSSSFSRLWSNLGSKREKFCEFCDKRCDGCAMQIKSIFKTPSKSVTKFIGQMIRDRKSKEVKVHSAAI